jgi:hypothetical protein
MIAQSWYASKTQTNVYGFKLLSLTHVSSSLEME